jgi:hypothetical protein
MIMSDPEPQSPFAEFATEKPSALEYLKARQEQESRSRKESWILLLILAFLSALMSGIGASLAAGWQVFFPATGFAIVGALLGLVAGWVLGAAIWARLAIGPKFITVHQDLVRGNPWDKLMIWLAVWGSIGISCGGAIGASKAVVSVLHVEAETVLPLSWAGSLAGIVIGFLLWFILRRSRQSD